MRKLILFLVHFLTIDSTTCWHEAPFVFSATLLLLFAFTSLSLYCITQYYHLMNANNIRRCDSYFFNKQTKNNFMLLGKFEGIVLLLYFVQHQIRLAFWLKWTKLLNFWLPNHQNKRSKLITTHFVYFNLITICAHWIEFYHLFMLSKTSLVTELVYYFF